MAIKATLIAAKALLDVVDQQNLSFLEGLLKVLQSRNRYERIADSIQWGPRKPLRPLIF